MQKKLIALAVAAAMTAPALAMADVSVYGKADIAVANTNNGAVGTTQMTSQVTKLGFKGSEDLGGGLNAIWQIEQQIDLNNAGAGNSGHNTFAGRNSFLGLKGGWGTLMVGRHDTPYKVSTRHLDVFGDQFADNRHLMGGGNAASKGSYMDARPGNEIMYVSPNMNGFSVAASYVFSNDLASTAAQQKGDLVSLNGVYNQGPLYVAAAYQKVKYGTSGIGSQYTALATATAANPWLPSDSLKAWKIGAGYWVTSALRVVGVYEKLTSSISSGLVASNAFSRNDWNIGAIYKFGMDDVKFSYTAAGNSGGVANTGAKMIGVGYDHNMSKRTSLYVQYNKLSNDSAASFGFNGAATTGVVAASAAGANLTGFLVGMKHTF